MKQLYLVRHAKAEKETFGHKDFDRELAYKGQVDAPRMGRIIATTMVKPSKIVSSPAARTWQTAVLFAEQLAFKKNDIELEPTIYEASLRKLLNVVNSLDDEHDCVMLIGHNPSLLHLSEYLTKEIIEHIPTCGVLLINFEVESWKFVSSATGSILSFIYPSKDES